jgi:hypothetical protein
VTVHPVPWLTVNVWPPAVIVPVRWGPALAATVNPTVPLPDPFAPELIVIQDAEVDAFHAHPFAVCTSKDPCPPLLPRSALVGARRIAHPVPCVTVNVWPPAVIVPARPGPALAATVNRTVPLPDPFAPALIVIHGVGVDAVHEQPDAVCTSKAPCPPPLPTSSDAGDRRNEHPSP